MLRHHNLHLRLRVERAAIQLAIQFVQVESRQPLFWEGFIDREA